MLKNKGTQCILICVCLIYMYSLYMEWELFGFANAEVFGHVWSQSWRFQNWPEGLFGTDQTIGTTQFPLIDPIPTLIVNAIGLFLPLTSAYNLLFLSSLAISAGVMRWMFLSDSEEPSGDISLILLVCASPMIWGSLNSGLTEDWGLFFPMLAIIALKRKQIRWAGIWVAVAAYWGLVLGWMSAILVSVYALLHMRSRRELLQMWLMMGVCVLPLMGLHWDRLWLEGHRSLAPPVQFEPMWVLNP